MTDYYAALGVPRTATADEIKQAFRRLASQHHPDKGGDTQKFQAIQEAYATLGDPEKRAAHDNPRPQTHFNFGNDMGGFNPSDIFNMFGVNMQHHTRQHNARVTLWIELEDTARGGPRVISLNTGQGVVNVEIDIPVGIDDGETIRYAQTLPGKQDLVITFRVRANGIWTKDGRNVITERLVPIWDMILGCELTVSDLLGNQLILVVPARSQPGHMLRVRGRGLPASTIPGRAGSAAGDLLIKLQASIPAAISDDLVSAIRKEQGQ